MDLCLFPDHRPHPRHCQLDPPRGLAVGLGQFLAAPAAFIELARQLQDAETERLKQGATDLLALQIREQAAFDAQVFEVEAQAEYFRAQANYRAATAADAPASLMRK